MPIREVPACSSTSAVLAAETQLGAWPLLTFAGWAFLLLGGDCAGTFAGFQASAVRDTLKGLLPTDVVSGCATRAPVAKVARLARQFVKPRSPPTTTYDGATRSSYFGDIINDIVFADVAGKPI